ncbi:hypothetical protein [Rhodopseudomonas palustris]|uniref:Uncharacterized protein n=1 Tax=Rhodopseudomonas palustris (strain BisB18) TaxID=316056 RepID=Q20YH5_RHOPB
MDPHSISTAIYALLIGGVLSLIGWVAVELYKFDSLRQILFVEICSFVAVIEEMELRDNFDAAIRDLPKKIAYSSEEDYFTLFKANAENLGLFRADTVGHVVACYTFMKGARDARRGAVGPTDSSDESAAACIWNLRHSARLVARSLREADEATKGLMRWPRREALQEVMKRILPKQSIAELADIWEAIAAGQSFHLPEQRDLPILQDLGSRRA